MSFINCILIAFCCAAMNHLGLIAAAEGLLRRRLPILNCPKCSTFWITLAYCIACHYGQMSFGRVIEDVATAFLMAYAVIWIELILGIISQLYNYAFDEIYPTAADAADATAAEREKGAHTDGSRSSADAMPLVRHSD